MGSGSIRANLIALGANQYDLPEQSEQLKLFFSLQIFAIKSGSLLGRFLNPILKENLHCFGVNDCYPLGFGIPSLAMIVAFIMMLIAKPFCKNKPPGGNMFVKVSKCMIDGIKGKFKKRKTIVKNHWLDYAEEKHGEKLVLETKAVASILVLYLPLPVFWAVYMQQGSRWIFQATRMNGDLGWYSVTPDQMIALNPIFVIATLPLCNFVIYPLLERIRIKSLLQKMTLGGMFAVAAFIVAGFIEMKIQREFVTIFWLAPQFFLLALSENFLFVSNLTLAYTEAPASMKSVMTSFVFVAIAIGNLFVIIISGAKLFESQAIEFFFFAGVLFVFMIIFGFLASRYKTASHETTKESRQQ